MKKIYRSLYVAYDPYPSYKGSSIHIDKASRVISQVIGDTLMLTLSRQRRAGIGGKRKHKQYEGTETNFLKKATAFSKWVEDSIKDQKHLRVAQFRDVWSGLPLLSRPHIRTVFEVNGLPSIELAYRYKHIGRGTLEKLEDLELECLQRCDHIVCPSEVIQSHLVKRKISPGKIHVISNGADYPIAIRKPRNVPDQYIVYFGALQPWQGVEVVLKALQYLGDKPELKLVICSSHKSKMARPYQRLARRMGLEDRVVWKYQLSKKSLFAVLSKAQCSVVPLTECSRNLEQGCSPLKIFESMACEVPIIASKLPVVEEILEESKEVKLVRPDRPADLARAIRMLVDHPDHGRVLASHALEKFKAKYTWEKVDDQLSEFYHKLLWTDTL